MGYQLKLRCLVQGYLSHDLVISPIGMDSRFNHPSAEMTLAPKGKHLWMVRHYQPLRWQLNAQTDYAKELKISYIFPSSPYSSKLFLLQTQGLFILSKDVCLQYIQQEIGGHMCLTPSHQICHQIAVCPGGDSHLYLITSAVHLWSDPSRHM